MVKDEIHARLQKYCGICGTHIAVGEKCVALFGKKGDSTAFACGADLPEFPDDSDFQPRVGMVRACSDPICFLCFESGETAQAHASCFVLFWRHCTASSEAQKMDRLWIAMAWRSPWRRTPGLHLKPDRFMSTACLTDMERELGLQGLHKLPPEIVQKIRERSFDSPLWCYSAVINLARELSCPVSEAVSTFPLADVVAWERGELPKTAADTRCDDSLIRLTMDARGIRTIERLSASDCRSPGGPPSDYLLYVVADMSKVQDITIVVKYGHARLEPSEAAENLTLWNVPTLFDPAAFGLSRPDPRRSTLRYRAIQLNSDITGLTFFLHGDRPHAIHAHTDAQPTAESTFYSMTSHCQQAVAWAYFPIPAGDRVLAFGTRSYSRDRHREHFCFLFHTLLSGTVELGSCIAGSVQDVYYRRHPPITLVYRYNYRQLIYDIGAGIADDTPVTTTAIRGTADDPFVHEDRPYPHVPRLRSSYFSRAPLASVVRIHVYNRCDSLGRTICQGVLLDYANGAQRALGNVRIGIDPVTVCDHPTRLCWRQAVPLLELPDDRTDGGDAKAMIFALTASATEDHHHEDGEAGWYSWSCVPLEGELRVWFLWRDADIRVVMPLQGEE